MTSVVTSFSYSDPSPNSYGYRALSTASGVGTMGGLVGYKSQNNLVLQKR